MKERELISLKYLLNSHLTAREREVFLMSGEKPRKKRNELMELQSIKNLLILQLLKSGATSEEIDKATKMGAGNIRSMFSGVKKKVKTAE